jgi:hypothetical protein
MTQDTSGIEGSQSPLGSTGVVDDEIILTNGSNNTTIMNKQSDSLIKPKQDDVVNLSLGSYPHIRGRSKRIDIPALNASSTENLFDLEHNINMEDSVGQKI